MRHLAHSLLLAVLLLGACVEDSPRDTVPEDTAAVDTSEIDTTQTAADSLAWTAEAVNVDRPVPEPAVVGELRAARHGEYDRLVLEFQNNVISGYDVSYLTESPIECGSGETINVTGNAILQVRLEPARGHNEQGQSTVDHGERQFDLPNIQEAEISCDFEAMFTVLLGLQERASFRVTELRDPARLVIDVQHTSNE